MDDAWNEKIPAQCTRNTKRVLQPALHCTVLWDVWSLGRGVCIFEKHPATSLHIKLNKGQNERKQIEIPPATQEHLQHKPVHCFLQLAFLHHKAAWILHAWGSSLPAGYLEQIFSWCKDPLKPVSAAHIYLCGAKRNGANLCWVSVLCILPWP